jgi:hypothetical protein
MIDTLSTKRRVAIPAGFEALDGRLAAPANPIGIVIFAHAGAGGGCTTCRFWPRKPQPEGRP